MPKRVFFEDLGIIDYKKAWDYQEELHKKVVDTKLKNRELSPENQIPTTHYLLYCEHPHVYTLGKSGSEENLLLNESQLAANTATFYIINRGGDITYHGPGQLVVYPIFDLENFFTDIHKYLRFLEAAVILTLQEYGLKAGRVQGLTGVWIEGENPLKARKICAMGVKCSRWITMHGIGFNINAELDYFKNIIPCGINDKAVTSMEKELGKKVDMAELKQKLLDNLANIFDFDYVSKEKFNS